MFDTSAAFICRGRICGSTRGTRKRFAFVSHAHSDHIAPHDEVIISERTARLMQARLPGRRTEHVFPFGEMRTVHDVDLMLLPAGHIFGSAQLFLSA